MIRDSTLNLSWPVIGAAVKVHIESTPTLDLLHPSSYIFKVTNQLPSSSTTNPKAFSERYITDEPIVTQTAFLTLAALTGYLSLACAAYGSVWKTATITTPGPRPSVTTLLPTPPKDKVLFSYESNPSFFLQSGSIITSTSPGFSSPKSPTAGGQKMVKLTRDEVSWVHDLLINVWVGMVENPSTK